jgi:osmotically inducible lipoprotein OsmB
MKPLLATAVLAVFLAGCASNTDSQRDRMLIGGGLGAATGAAIGAAAGSTWGGAAAGAAIGAVGGGIIGVVTTPRNCIARDQDGTPYKVRCP